EKIDMLSFEDEFATALPSRRVPLSDGGRDRSPGILAQAIGSPSRSTERSTEPSPMRSADADRDAEPPREATDMPNAAEQLAAANGFRRVRIEDKRVINASSDVNQLVPFKY